MTDNPTLLSSLAEHWYLARTLRGLRIHYNAALCRGIWQCIDVCPIGCWKPDFEQGIVVHYNTEKCIACGACVLQCPEGAIELK